MKTFHVDEPKEIGKKKVRVSSNELNAVKSDIYERLVKEEKVMKLTMSELKDAINQGIESGFFDEITEDIIADDKEMYALMGAFLTELRKKRVVRGRKIFKKVICPGNKRYVPALKKCVIKTSREKMKKRRAMKRGAIKKKGRMGRILRRRLKSLKKRKAFGLKRGR